MDTCCTHDASSGFAKARTTCAFKCMNGFQLEGPKTTKCTENGTWTNEPPSCKPKIAPIMTCPQDVVQTLPPGASETWVTLPPPNTNLDPNSIRVSPFWVQKHGGSFSYGETDVTYSVNDTKNDYSLSCTFKVDVRDKEPPKVEKCPDTVSALATTLDGVFVTWDEPEFSDNVEVIEVRNTL
ncbi:unnamed protein product, partial [Ixodes pacificus]